MPRTQNRSVMRWLLALAGFVAVLIVFGGFVRLTRSGLSIVEWNPISGAMPPIGEQAWADEFARYQQTPEYQKINTGMPLDEYKYIFYIEWIHRNLARLAGLIYALPFFYFLIRKQIAIRDTAIYLAIGLLFLAQATAGWAMVASGLEDRPSVSHFALTIHLLLALSLFGITLWIAFGHRYGFTPRGNNAQWSLASKLSLVGLILLLVQISFGGLTAGLKAGHLSDTWPQMFGQWIPQDLITSWSDVFESPLTVVFIHRWLGWLVFLIAPLIYFIVRRQNYPREIQVGLLWLTADLGVQIALGILTILSRVNIVIALLHQANTLALFALSLYLLHRFRALDQDAYGRGAVGV